MVTAITTTLPARQAYLAMSGAGGPQDLGADGEARLLRAAAAGDRQAAAALVEATYGGVYALLIRSTGDPDLATDLTQETYRKAWASIGEFRGQAKFSTWLYRIAYTTFLNHARKPRRMVPLSDELAATVGDPGPDPERQSSDAGQASQLRRAVLALPEELRETVMARYWRGLDVEEIARGAGITGVAIRKRLKKALVLLAGRLEEVQS